jgi:hypothetical protein
LGTLSLAFFGLKIGEGNMSILLAVPPVIDVVTGTDWPAIITGIATGLAALAGIGGTAYLAHRASNDARKNLKAASDEAQANREAASADLQASLQAAAAQLAASINAEDKRAHIAEKRRIYASALTAMNETMIAAAGYRVARNRDNDELKTAISRQAKAQDGMYQAMGVLFLIASPEVAGNAVALQNTLVQFMNASHAGEPFAGPEVRAVGGAREVLLRSMRQDLGEPVGIAGDQDVGKGIQSADPRHTAE